jgi:hypothetical protein
MGRLAAIDARLRPLPADRVLAASAVLLAVTNAVEVAADPGRRDVALVFTVLFAAPLAFAWRAPLGALLAFDGLALIEAALGGRVFGTTVSVACF